MTNLVIPSRQWRKYDCCAAVLRMGIHYFTKKRMSYSHSIAATGCKPEGTSFTHLKKVFRSNGILVGQVTTGVQSIKNALDKNKLVVIDDNKTYKHDHALLITGYINKFFWVIDPVIGIPTLRSCSRVSESATEAFSIYSNK